MDVTQHVKFKRKNPRYAAALRYRPGTDCAPVVLAAGRDAIAARILELAEDAGVPDYVEPALAELLSKMEPGSVIPEATYQAVASVLAFVWRLDKKYHTGKERKT